MFSGTIFWNYFLCKCLISGTCLVVMWSQCLHTDKRFKYTDWSHDSDVHGCMIVMFMGAWTTLGTIKVSIIPSGLKLADLEDLLSLSWLTSSYSSSGRRFSIFNIIMQKTVNCFSEQTFQCVCVPYTFPYFEELE